MVHGSRDYIRMRERQTDGTYLIRESEIEFAECVSLYVSLLLGALLIRGIIEKNTATHHGLWMEAFYLSAFASFKYLKWIWIYFKHENLFREELNIPHIYDFNYTNSQSVVATKRSLNSNVLLIRQKLCIVWRKTCTSVGILIFLYVLAYRKLTI